MPALPNSTVVTGPNFQLTAIERLLITPEGGSQISLGQALGGGSQTASGGGQVEMTGGYLIVRAGAGVTTIVILPTDPNLFFPYTVKYRTGGPVTVVAPSIDGATNFIMATLNESATFVNDGIDWSIV